MATGTGTGSAASGNALQVRTVANGIGTDAAAVAIHVISMKKYIVTPCRRMDGSRPSYMAARTGRAAACYPGEVCSVTSCVLACRGTV